MARDRLISYAELASVLDNLPLLLREARRARGLSVRAAAELIDGVSFNTLSRLERGRDVNLSNATAIMRWLEQPAPSGLGEQT